MVTSVEASERKKFDRLATHPLQSWAWGEFRLKTGVKVSRLGRYDDKTLIETAQVTYHKLPGVPLTIGYWPKGGIPSLEMVRAVMAEAKKHSAVLVKLEPNILRQDGQTGLELLRRNFSLYPGRALFTRFSLWLDLRPMEDALLSNLHPKTRYNTRLAQRKGVKIQADSSPEAFEEYWRLTEETARRQGFYAHNRGYHQFLYETLIPAGLAQLFTATYEGKVLVAWIVFNLNKVLYYPYGASTRDDRNVFASNLMMWEVIKWGKKGGCELFDMWGSPGPDPKPSDDWYGFHRFKLGYGAKVVEFVGTYDLVVNPLLYPLYRLGNDFVRWQLLRLKAKLTR